MSRGSFVLLRQPYLFLMLAMVNIAGCGYVVGPPYQAEFRSVHVPIFKNETFRRGYELQLTEAVQKKIQLNTPYRLVNNPQADTQLTGRILSIEKRPANQNRFDDPRELELAIGIEATWTNTRTGAILAQQTYPISTKLNQAIAHASFAPEAGQSMATATEEAMDQLAPEIVGIMEAPW